MAPSIRTLRFKNVHSEEAFVRGRHSQLKSRFTIGVCFAFGFIVSAFIVSAMLSMILGTSDLYLDTDDGKRARKYRAFLWCLIIAFCGAGVAVNLSPIFKNSRALVFEWWLVCWVCILLGFCTIQHPWYFAKVIGSDPRVIIAPGDVVDADHLLLLDALLTGCHFMLPLRWVALVPIEIFTFLCYAVPTILFGSAYKINVCIMNHGVLILLIAIASIGKRDLEAHERAAFIQVAEERTLRCQAENQLHMVGADTAGPRQASQAADTASSAARSIPETTQTGQIFGGFERDGCNIQEQMEKMIKVGVEEHWLVHHQDLQPKPDVYLASGGFGIVTAVLYHGAQVVVKMPRCTSDTGGMAPRQLLAMAQELRIFRRLRHPNIVLFYGAAINPVSPDVFLILEHVRGSELRVEVNGPCLTNKSCGHRCNLLNDICCALNYLHSQRPAIIHGDIKDSNVMVERYGQYTRAKLLDFGLSRLLTPNAHKLGGTLRWAAPEVILQSEAALALSADIFSLGRLIYFIITGAQPLRNVDRRDIVANASSGQCISLRWPAGALCRQPAEEAVACCTAFDPLGRPSISEVRRSLGGWADVVDDPSLKAVLAIAFPTEKECNVVEELWKVRTAHAGKVAKGGAAGQPRIGGAGAVTLLYPELKETPKPTRLHALVATMMTWNIPVQSKACCDLHPLIHEVESIIECLSSRRCSEMRFSIAWQCPNCLLIDLSKDHNHKGCYQCGYQGGATATEHNELVACEECLVPSAAGIKEDPPPAKLARDVSTARADAKPCNRRFTL